MQKIDSRKILLTILFVLILVIMALLVGRVSYGYLAPVIGDDASLGSDVTANGDTLVFKKGGTISLSATTDNFYTSKGNLSEKTKPSAVLIARSSSNGEEVSATANYNVGVSITGNSFQYTTDEGTPELILTVRDETGVVVSNTVDGLEFTEVNGISGYDITGKSGTFCIDKDHVITTNDSNVGTTQEWTFTLTFINLDTDQSLNENASMTMNILLQTEDIASEYSSVQG